MTITSFQGRKRKRSKTSWVWKYFTLDSVTNLNSCDLSDYNRNHDKSSTYMSDHLRRHHSISSELIQYNSKQKLYCNSSNSKTIYYSESESEPEEKIPKITEKNDTNVYLSTTKRAKINEKMKKFLIATDQPISLVERDEFKELLKELNGN
ncbi:unnamed protein product [Brachionus calyciflorus]|uniref:Uncharacterized protein n=1 Tax=Brachionus calyciflorus TaxID=104777 RepID=A0A813ZXK7_9BILA|nr:unnamed protein product [Brachionus calyciflorus]